MKSHEWISFPDGYILSSVTSASILVSHLDGCILDQHEISMNMENTRGIAGSGPAFKKLTKFLSVP